MLDATHYNQRTAAITGAGSGLDRDIALSLAAKDYRVFSTTVSSEESLHFKQAVATANEIRMEQLRSTPCIECLHFVP
jgi:NAD(P)-dependent dehydrogenase (short-subunit alcohol dehydrogenase family)